MYVASFAEDDSSPSCDYAAKRIGVKEPMRKTKDIKRKKREAGIEYKRGNRKDAYKMWGEAKKELDELRGRNQPAPQSAEGAA